MAENYIALLVEGTSEAAIIDVLLDNDKLIYTRQELINEKVVNTRSARNFQKEYLNHSMDKLIKIIRIHDSKAEKFKLSKPYLKKIVEPIEEIYTTPEIEILFIILMGDYGEFTNKSKKLDRSASSYAKDKYNLNQIKKYKFVYDFWSSRVDDLVDCISKYDRYHKHSGNKSLYLLLK